MLLNGADDGFEADADTGGFSVPPKELPTIRSTPPMATYGADDAFATDADTGRFSAQTKELPTIRPTPPMARATEYPR